jgi:hypothetical protein
VCNNAKAVNIAFLVIHFPFAIEHLGRHVPNSSAFLEVGVICLRGEVEGEAKVDDFHLITMDINDNVLRLNIPMDNQIVMAILDAHEDIGEQVFDVRDRNIQLHPNEGHQVNPWNVLHQDDVLLVGFIKFLKLIDIGAVLQIRQQPLFL